VIGRAEGLPIPAVSTCAKMATAMCGSELFGGRLNRWRDGALTRFESSKGVTKAISFPLILTRKAMSGLSAGREDLFMLGMEIFPSRPSWFMAVKVIWWIIGDKCGLETERTDVSVEWVWQNQLRPRQLDWIRKDVRALARIGRATFGLGLATVCSPNSPGGNSLHTRMKDSLEKPGHLVVAAGRGRHAVGGKHRGGLLRFKGGKFTATRRKADAQRHHLPDS